MFSLGIMLEMREANTAVYPPSQKVMHYVSCVKKREGEILTKS